MTIKTRLIERLKVIEDEFVEILKQSNILSYTQKPNPYSSFSGRPQVPTIKQKWADLNIDLERKQHQLSKDFDEWYTDFSYLLEREPDRINLQFSGTYLINDAIIKHRSFGSMPTSTSDAISSFRDELSPFYSYLDTQSSEDQTNILIVDTNVIIDAHDISQFPNVIGFDSFSCVIVPVIIEELDELKIKSKDKALLAKISDAIRYIKGLSKLGSVVSGVNITDKISVILRAKEADFSELPRWLNMSIRDDRIVGSAIELSRENPDSHVIVLSNDTNMHTKCSFAGISFSDFDIDKLKAP